MAPVSQPLRSAAAEQAPATPLEENHRHCCLALAYHALGREVDAENEREHYKALDGDTSTSSYSRIYGEWDNVSAALQWLVRAEQAHGGGLRDVKLDPLLDPIRTEPQFEALMARMKFPP